MRRHSTDDVQVLSPSLRICKEKNVIYLLSFFKFFFLFTIIHNQFHNNTLNINMQKYESWFESYKSLIHNSHSWKLHRTIHNDILTTVKYDNNAICWKIITKKENLPKNFSRIFPWILYAIFGFDSLKMFFSNCCAHSKFGFSKNSISSKHEIINRSYSDHQIPRQNIQWKFQAHLQLDYIFFFFFIFLSFHLSTFSYLSRLRRELEEKKKMNPVVAYVIAARISYHNVQIFKNKLTNPFFIENWFGVSQFIFIIVD